MNRKVSSKQIEDKIRKKLRDVLLEQMEDEPEDIAMSPHLKSLLDNHGLEIRDDVNPITPSGADVTLGFDTLGNGVIIDVKNKEVLGVKKA